MTIFTDGVCLQVPKAQGRDSEARIHDNQMDIVKLLVSHGADLKITDHSGEDALIFSLGVDKIY